MALSKLQLEELDLSSGVHAATHSRGGTDEIYVVDLAGTNGVGDVLYGSNNSGIVTTVDTEPLYVTGVVLAELENEGNWFAASYAASSGYAGQRAVSTDKSYFYECITDSVWVRYGIAIAYFNAYLTNVGSDGTVRVLLQTSTNWTNGTYSGSAISNTFQGQSHYDARYKYDAVDDNVWIRTPRQ